MSHSIWGLMQWEEPTEKQAKIEQFGCQSWTTDWDEHQCKCFDSESSQCRFPCAVSSSASPVDVLALEGCPMRDAMRQQERNLSHPDRAVWRGQSVVVPFRHGSVVADEAVHVP